MTVPYKHRLEPLVKSALNVPASKSAPVRPYKQLLKHIEATALALLLERHSGCFSKVARDIGMDRGTVKQKAKLHGLV